MRLIFLFAALSPILLASCTSTRQIDTITVPPVLESSNLVLGEKAFMHFCDKCHPRGGKGLGPSLNKPLPRALIRLQVRKGLGAMPPFSDKLLPDDQLGFIADYIKLLKKSGIR